MVEKTIWQQRLDDIVSGNIEKPELVEILRLPDIDAWQQGKLVTHWDVDEAFFTVGQNLFGGYIACLADLTPCLPQNKTTAPT
jgi:acyl-coenzyme A thioesterase PaaI-like protein